MSVVWNYKKWGFEGTPYTAVAIRAWLQYTNSCGYDLRELYFKIEHERCKSYDEKKFAPDPTGQDGGLDRMLYQVFMCKYVEHVKNLSHIFKTGLGVVAERNPHSDSIYFYVGKGSCGLDMQKFLHVETKDMIKEWLETGDDKLNRYFTPVNCFPTQPFLVVLESP